MQQRVCVTAWLLGVAVLGFVLQEGSMARASGVRVTGGGVKQLGEPYYLYIVEVYLDPNSQFEAGDSFTLHSLAGVQYPGSTTGSPGGTPSGPWGTSFTNLPDGLLPNYSPPTTVPFADLTFINGSNVVKNEGTTEDYIGEFKVLTSVSLPAPPGVLFRGRGLERITPRSGWQPHHRNGNRCSDLHSRAGFSHSPGRWGHRANLLVHPPTGRGKPLQGPSPDSRLRNLAHCGFLRPRSTRLLSMV